MAKYTYGTQVTLMDGGTSAAVINNAMSAASIAYTSTTPAPGHGDRPLARMALSIPVPAAAFTAGSTFDIYCRPRNVVGANHVNAPTTSYKQKLIGQFKPDAVATAQYLEETVMLPSKELEIYILNNATGQSLPAGWALYATPFEIA